MQPSLVPVLLLALAPLLGQRRRPPRLEKLAAEPLERAQDIVVVVARAALALGRRLGRRAQVLFALELEERGAGALGLLGGRGGVGGAGALAADGAESASVGVRARERGERARGGKDARKLCLQLGDLVLAALAASRAGTESISAR